MCRTDEEFLVPHFFAESYPILVKTMAVLTMVSLSRHQHPSVGLCPRTVLMNKQEGNNNNDNNDNNNNNNNNNNSNSNNRTGRNRGTGTTECKNTRQKSLVLCSALCFMAVLRTVACFLPRRVYSLNWMSTSVDRSTYRS